MLELLISLKKGTSYTNTGNFLSKSLIIKENLAKFHSLIIIVEKESDIEQYKKILWFLWVPYQTVETFSDFISIKEKSHCVFLIEIDELEKYIIPEREQLKNMLIFKIWQKWTQEEYIKTLTWLGYEFHEYGKPGSYKKLWDTIHIEDFDDIHRYKISFWWDEIESISIESDTKQQNKKIITLGSNQSFISDTETENTLLSSISDTGIFTILDTVEFQKSYQNIISKLPLSCSFDIIGNKTLKIVDLKIEYIHISSIEKLKEWLRKEFASKTIITKNPKLIEGFLENSDIQGVHVEFAKKNFLKSFTYKFEKILICDDILSQIFIKSRIKKKLSEDIDLLLKIKNGDYIVHIDHGLWKFEGIIEKELLGIKKEYIELTYKEWAKVFVPVTEVARVSKYVWAENPKLTSLWGKSWEKKIKNIQVDIQHIAEELLETYANRKIWTGFCFQLQEDKMKNFQDSFPFSYTDGQEEAISEILSDMQAKKAMDRLLVWDVWFGKTEIAFNAIYNAYLNKKQSVLISPLVVLAYEHYEKARERFESFGMKVAVLTRLEKQSEVTKTLAKLKSGEIDLIVGTHRLLSDKILFKDLWILVVDEEHKFGVQDKEKIKNFKKTVDVLAMSATPIPRSLNMALSSIRSISILKTPPYGRKNIQTHISKFDEKLIQEAGNKEFKRWGQLFFIHNKVSNISVYKKKLEEMFPGKKVGVTHGQLPGTELENRIIQFKYHEFDILLSTTVIENGIDFANVNTIFINDCQNFGISQIHQLRWRVGRSNKQWYCYLLYKQDSLNTDAARRLKTIVEYSYLWAGFELAMKDLEIRWWWDILGIRQSGQAREIWVSLFIKMLEEKIEELRKTPGKSRVDKLDTKIDLQISAFIPDEYFNSETDKLNFYREIESLSTLKDLEIMIQDFKLLNKNFSQEVSNLFQMLEVKLKAKKHKIIWIKRVWVSYQIDFKKSISLEELKSFLKLDREVLFSVVDIQRLRSPRKHFENDKKFLEYLLQMLSNKVQSKKIKIKK